MPENSALLTLSSLSCFSPYTICTVEFRRNLPARNVLQYLKEERKKERKKKKPNRGGSNRDSTVPLHVTLIFHVLSA